MPPREAAWCRCQCGHRFRVLADEVGQHGCPRCGDWPGDEQDEDAGVLPDVCLVCGGDGAVNNDRCAACHGFGSTEVADGE